MSYNLLILLKYREIQRNTSKARKIIARWAHNPKVGGSNPPPATNNKNNILRFLKEPLKGSFFYAFQGLKWTHVDRF